MGDRTKARLICQAEAFAVSERIAVSGLALEMVKDNKFFVRLESGRDCTTGTYDRFQAYFIARGYDPDELARQGATMRKRGAHDGTVTSAGHAVTAQATENCA